MKKKVILAYSGGLDTSVILHWLIHKGYDVVCFVADVGQQEDFQAIKDKARAIGACNVYMENLQQEFVQNYIFKALKANAAYESYYLLGTSLARPLIAKKQVEIARAEKTSLLAHGATGKGNDQVRFELTYAGLMPEATVIAPWKMPEFLAQFQGRKELIAYARQHAIPISATLEKPYSIDENLMHTSYESGILENPAHAPHESMFTKTVSPYQAPDKPAQIYIEFDAGIPVAVTNTTENKKITGALELFTYLNTLGGAHGIGRIDIVENRFVGIKSRGIYETPAGTILFKAHKDIESLTLDKEVAHSKILLEQKIAQLIYNGFWESPEMAFFMAAVEHSQKNVSGTVHITLYKGNVIVTGRSSHVSLYDHALASMDVAGGYNQEDAKGFINVQAVRLKQGKTYETMAKK